MDSGLRGTNFRVSIWRILSLTLYPILVYIAILLLKAYHQLLRFRVLHHKQTIFNNCKSGIQYT